MTSVCIQLKKEKKMIECGDLVESKTCQSLMTSCDILHHEDNNYYTLFAVTSVTPPLF